MFLRQFIILWLGIECVVLIEDGVIEGKKDERYRVIGKCVRS